MDNDAIRFHARFGGVSREIYVPVNNVMAIYANENGQGMAFEPQLGGSDASAGQSSPTVEEPSAPALASVPSIAPAPAPVSTAKPDDGASPDDDNEPPRKGGRPTLTRIK